MLVVMDRRGAGERGPPRIYADGDGAKQNGVNQLSTRLGANQDTSLPFVGDNVPELIELLGPTGVVTQRLRLTKDQVGTVELVTDASTGEVLQRIEHDEFGRVLSDSNPGLQPFGFAGGLYDPETRLVRFGARDYDPAIGRWTARDPVRFAGGHNAYEYSLNSPVQGVDPSGYDPRATALVVASGLCLGYGVGNAAISIWEARQLGKDLDAWQAKINSLDPEDEGYYEELECSLKRQKEFGRRQKDQVSNVLRDGLRDFMICEVAIAGILGLAFN